MRTYNIVYMPTVKRALTFLSLSWVKTANKSMCRLLVHHCSTDYFGLANLMTQLPCCPQKIPNYLIQILQLAAHWKKNGWLSSPTLGTWGLPQQYIPPTHSVESCDSETTARTEKTPFNIVTIYWSWHPTMCFVLLKMFYLVSEHGRIAHLYTFQHTKCLRFAVNNLLRGRILITSFQFYNHW